MARVFAQPFSKTDSVFRGLGAGAAVGHVSEVGNKSNSLLPTYTTETQLAFFSYNPAPATSGSTSGGSTGTGNAVAPTYADGNRLRISPQAFYYYKSFGLLAEYGEKATFDTVKPLRPFALGEPGRGVVELATRYSQLKLDPAIFSTVEGVLGTWFLNYTDTSF